MYALDQTFAALGDATRRAIVARLSAGETPLSELAEPFEMSLTAVSKHVRVLSDAGLVTVSKRGRTRYCQLEGTPMQAAVDWLNDYRAFWDSQFTQLAAFLEEDDPS
ncbi:MAG: ArsR/SmtB family transcription factor [Alphaproteobacteria bacterium]